MEKRIVEFYDNKACDWKEITISTEGHATDEEIKRIVMDICWDAMDIRIIK